MVAISRRAYAELYGPTKGDLVRLGDTSLLAEIEHDYTVPGHELVVGAGKTLRDSEGINARMRYSDKALDIVIQNATIIDAELGIVKADIGIRDRWMVIKSGFVVWSAMGDGNGSMPLSEPIVQRKMWGALGTAPQHLGVVFASKLAIEAGVRAKLGLVKPMLQIKSVRALRKSDMIRNAAMPHIEVDPQTFEVRADGRLLMGEPPSRVPLSRRYMLR